MKYDFDITKYDFNKVSKEALITYTKTCMKNNYYTGSQEGKEVLRQARVETAEEVALELAECCSELMNNCDYGYGKMGSQLHYSNADKIREITKRYINLKK